MDWKVSVITKNNQIKQIVVTDYVNPIDAKNAAVAQTDAKSVISISPYTESNYFDRNYSPEESRIDSNSSSYNDDDTVEWLFNDAPKWFQLICFSTVALLMMALLWICNPVLGFLFGGYCTWFFLVKFK